MTYTLGLSALLIGMRYILLVQAREGWMLDDDERMSAAVIQRQKALKRYEVSIRMDMTGPK